MPPAYWSTAPPLIVSGIFDYETKTATALQVPDLTVDAFNARTQITPFQF